MAVSRRRAYTNISDAIRNFMGACDNVRPKLAPLHQVKAPFRNVSERGLGGWGLLGFVR